MNLRTGRRVTTKKSRAPILLAGLAVLLALAASIWLAFAPFYEGMEQAAQGMEQPVDAPIQVSTSATLIQVNGYWVISLLLVPVALTTIGFWGARSAHSPARRTKIMWASTGLLALFCILGLWSIGSFYLPAAGALGAAAAVGRFDWRQR